MPFDPYQYLERRFGQIKAEAPEPKEPLEGSKPFDPYQYLERRFGQIKAEIPEPKEPSIFEKVKTYSQEVGHKIIDSLREEHEKTRQLHESGGMEGPLGIPITREQLEAVDSPIFPVSRYTEKALDKTGLSTSNSTAARLTTGITRSAGKNLETLATPRNIGLITSAIAFPPAGLAMAGYYGPQMIKHSYESLKAGKTKRESGDVTGAAESYADAAFSGYLGGKMTQHLGGKAMELAPVRSAIPKIRQTFTESLFPRLTEAQKTGEVPFVPGRQAELSPATTTIKEPLKVEEPVPIRTEPQKLPVSETVKLEDWERDSLEALRSRIESAEAGKRIFKEAEPGAGGTSEVIAQPSTFPIPDLGPKTHQLRVIDRALDEKQLSPAQMNTFDAMRQHIINERENFLFRPQERTTGELNLQKGDQVRVGGEWLKVTRTDPDTTTLKDGKTIRVDSTFDKLPVEGGDFGIKRAGQPAQPVQGFVQGRAASRPEKMLPMEQPAEITTPIGAQAITQQIQREFDVPIRTGHYRANMGMGKSRVGIFKTKAEVVRLKTANDLETLSHEIGHAIDKRELGANWNAPELKPFRDELKKLDYDQVKQRPNEGFAEYVRHYLSTGEAAQRAPQFHKWFQDILLERNPDLAQRLRRTQASYSQWQQQGAEARVLGQIDLASKGPKVPLGEKSARVWRRFRTLFEDQLHSIKYATEQMLEGGDVRPSKNPYEIATATQKTAAAQARMFIEDGIFDFGLNKTGPGLKEVLQPVSGRIDSFLAYAYARRAIDLLKRKINPGISQADAQFVFSKYDSIPEFLKAADGMNEWSNGVLKYWKDAGGLTDEAMKIIRDANPFYIPLKRVFDRMQGRGGGPGGGFVDLGSPVKRIKGSGRMIQDPLISLFQDAEKIIATANKARVARALVELAESREGTGRWVEKVDAPKEVHRGKLEDLQKQLEAAGADLSRADLDSMIQFFSQAHQYYGKDNIVTIVRNGKREFYELDPELYQAMKGMDRVTLPWLINVTFGSAKRTMTLGATGVRAGFQLITNPIRDTWTAMVQSKDPGLMVPARALKALLQKDPELDARWRRGGGEMAQPLGLDMNRLRMVRDDILANDARSRALNVVKHPIEVLRAMLSFTEAMNRKAEFAQSEAKYGRGTEDAAIAASNAAAEVTLNFRRAGYYGQIINQLVAFWNPQVQGFSKLARTIGEAPLKTGMAAVASLTAPAMALWWLHKDEKWYQELPQWEKFLFLHFKPGDQIIRLPMPQEFGYLFAAIPVLVADSVRNRSPEEFRKGAAYITQQIIPDIVPTLVKPGAEAYFNYDAFRGGPIESESMQRLLPGERYRASTEPVFIEAGKRFGVSPVMLHHLVQGYTGGMGTDIAGVSKYMVSPQRYGFREKPTEPADIPVVGRLFSRQNRPGESVNEAYDKFQHANQVHATLDKLMKEGKREEFIRLRDREKENLRELPRMQIAIELMREAGKNQNLRLETDIARKMLHKEGR